MTNWFGIAGGIILGVLGTLHLIYTLRDLTGRPRFFAPRDVEMLEAMQRTTAGIAPKGRDYWQALLGFHISHSLAVLMAAGIVIGASVSGPVWLGFTGLAVTLIYAFLSWRFWFAIPMWGCVMSAVLQIIGLAAA